MNSFVHTCLKLCTALALLAAAGCAPGQRADTAVKVGDLAPDFGRMTYDATPVSLSALRGTHFVVLYFYPKDDTPGCTAEACAFRDSYAAFTNINAVVIGVSGDPDASHRAFVEKHRLPFLLVSDRDGGLRAAYGVPAVSGMPGRVTYVIDRRGIVRHVFASQADAAAHAQNALDVVRELARE